MKWNDDWRKELEEIDYDCYERLCECRNIKKDIFQIARLMLKYNLTFGAEESLIRTLEWIGDWNGQFELTDLGLNEYKKILDNLLI